MTEIVLIDDHPLAINGIGAWLESTGKFKISGAAGTLAEAQNLLEQIDHLPEIIILDLSLGRENGLEIMPMLKEISKKRNAGIPSVLVCSMYEDPFLIQRSLDLGAKAYVSKSAECCEIINAINAILAGSTYTIPECSGQSRKKVWSSLSPRENEIVALVKRSMSNKEIAKHLGLSIRTIENHLAHIYVKTDTSSRADLIEI